jgi:hypothetical protein
MKSAAPAPITNMNKVTNLSSRPSPMSTHSSPTLLTSNRLDVESPFSPLPYGRSAPGSKANSVRSRTEASDSLPELHKYTEDAEEDYSDILDKPMGKSSDLNWSQLTYQAASISRVFNSPSGHIPLLSMMTKRPRWIRSPRLTIVSMSRISRPSCSGTKRRHSAHILINLSICLSLRHLVQHYRRPVMSS